MLPKIKIAGLVFVSSLCLINASYAQEPENLNDVKQSLMAYHDSGEYAADQQHVIDQAKAYLKSRLANNPSHKKLAMVFDIDETTLSNYPSMVEMSFGGTNAQMDAAIDEGKDPVIPSTFQLYRYAKTHDVSVFFVTGRKEKSRAPTEQNLMAAGYNDWTHLYLKPNDYNKKSVIPYKAATRKAIEAQGYDIVITIGDQQSDLKGGYADHGFKLPNPYYFLR